MTRMTYTADKVRVITGQNLRRLRLGRGWTLEKLAEMVDSSPQYISAIEGGKRGLGVNLLTRLCNVFNVEAAEFTMAGDNAKSVPPPSGEIAVISMVNGGPAGFYENPFADGGGFRYIKRPYDVTDPSAYAVEVRGDSMTPRYESGEMVIASPEKEVRNGDYVVVQLANGEMAIKRIKFHNGMVVLSSVNPTVEAWICKPEEILAYHKVVWKKERS